MTLSPDNAVWKWLQEGNIACFAASGSGHPLVPYVSGGFSKPMSVSGSFPSFRISGLFSAYFPLRGPVAGEKKQSRRRENGQTANYLSL